SKLRQQRANSIEAERAASTSKGSREHSFHDGSISSNSSSNPGGQQQGQPDYALSKQVFAEPDQLHSMSGSNEFAYSGFENPPYMGTHDPWLDYPPSSYPASSVAFGTFPSLPEFDCTFDLGHGNEYHDHGISQSPTRSVLQVVNDSSDHSIPAFDGIDRLSTSRAALRAIL
ncbi:MAG: hypothetical protein Q9169_008740, partial [Polycauliona sp. 2 TL-2023]